MKKLPLISIIIPIYKVENYLNKCIESVVNQTYRSLEIILVDDGSPDNCPQICDEWAKKDDRIKVIHKENGGVSSARNAGLESAQSKYIMFVDPDDYIDIQMLEKMYEAIEDCDCVYCKYNNDVNGDIIKCDEVNISKLNQKDRLKFFIGDKTTKKKNRIIKQSIMGSVWRILFKREIIEDLRFDTKLKYSEDFVFIMNVFEKNPKIGYLDDFLYYYVFHNTSYSSSIRMSKIDNYLSIIPFIERLFNKKEYKKRLNYFYFSTALNIYFILRSNKLTFKDLDNKQLNFVKKNLVFSKFFDYCKFGDSFKHKILALLILLKLDKLVLRKN